MKKLLIAMLSMALVLGMVSVASAYTRGAIPGKPVVFEGTIQGLESACYGVYCSPGNENITAASEDEFVLVTSEGSFYTLPNLKSTLLARYLSRPVRIIGDEAMGGKAVLVEKAEVMEKGKWVAFWSPEIAEKARNKTYLGKRQ